MAAHSDIDILVVGSVGVVTIQKHISKLRRDIDREISVTVMSQADFNRRIKAEDIVKSLKIDNKDFDLAAVNIEYITRSGNALIFKLLPKAIEYDTQDLIRRYAAILPFLKAA